MSKQTIEQHPELAHADWHEYEFTDSNGDFVPASEEVTNHERRQNGLEQVVAAHEIAIEAEPMPHDTHITVHRR